jgi:hypothetical protein
MRHYLCLLKGLPGFLGPMEVSSNGDLMQSSFATGGFMNDE